MTPSDSTRRIVIAGGGGLIGRHLASALLARGDEVLVLSRDPASVQTRLPARAVLPWHPGSDGRWRNQLDVVDAVVDVSGAHFFTKWRGNYYKREVLGSRRTAIRALQAEALGTRVVLLPWSRAGAPSRGVPAHGPRST